MFRQRLLTALVLVPLVLFAIYYANAWILGTIVLLLIALGGWEWLQLIPLNDFKYKCVFLVFLILAVGLGSLGYVYWLIGGLLLWALILFAVVTFPVSQALWGHRFLVAGACFLLLPLAANTLVVLYQQPQGKNLVVYLLCLVWATDIGAYLAGKRWGATKLIPMVSPGKTVEGTFGGFSLAMLVAVVGYFYFKPNAAVIWYAVAIGTVFISMLGDLFISMLKRRSKIKDTGHIFPGHGGVLDRIDSLIAALPVFYFGLSFLVLGR